MSRLRWGGKQPFWNGCAVGVLLGFGACSKTDWVSIASIMTLTIFVGISIIETLKRLGGIS